MEQVQGSNSNKPSQSTRVAFNGFSHTKATLTGIVLNLPLDFLGVGFFTLPWIIGREAGTGTYKQENNMDAKGYKTPLFNWFDPDTLEGQSWRKSYKNVFNEAAGLGKSLIPFIAATGFWLAAGITKENAVPAALTIVLTHMVGGIALSYHHSKKHLAPLYANELEAYRQQTPKAPTNTL